MECLQFWLATFTLFCYLILNFHLKIFKQMVKSEKENTRLTSLHVQTIKNLYIGTKVINTLWLDIDTVEVILQSASRHNLIQRTLYNLIKENLHTKLNFSSDNHTVTTQLIWVIYSNRLYWSIPQLGYSRWLRRNKAMRIYWKRLI